jgi:carboxypeptidase family protein
VTRYHSLVSSLSSAALLLILALSVFAQTSSTGTIVGTVTDKTGAALAGAEVQLSDKVTNQVVTAIADDNGRYIFPSVLPADYTLSGVKQGFRKALVAGVKVEVTKSYTIDIALEVGEAQQAVEIKAAAGTELQTGDSTVGNVLSSRLLPPIPAFTRQVNELIRYQPLITPDGAVAGARQDQITFALDGIDVTDNTFGGRNPFAADNAIGGLNTFMRLPLENVDEFRVAAANSNALFGRGSGGQVSVISRRGTADYHGAAYWFHQNDNLNAATWTNKRSLGQDISDPTLRHQAQEPEMKNNRFGFSYGGPYPWWENTFFFMNFEGQRFPRSSGFSRLVPTETLKQGILRFRDGAGNIVGYDLASSSLCGDGTGACDPRGLGLNPAISTLWANLPVGNDPGLGDGLNTIGYRGTVGTSLNSNYFNGRFDRSFGENWRFDAAFRFFGEKNVGANQVSIIQGANQSRENIPSIQNMARVGIGGPLTNNLTADFAFGWTRSRVSVNRFTTFDSANLLAVPGAGISTSFAAVDLVGLDEPIDVGAQFAGKQAIDNRNFQLNADFNWLKGPHTVQFGTHVRYLPTRYTRDFKDGGGLTWFTAQMNAGSGASLQIPDSLRPPICNNVITTNCLQRSDMDNWDQFYAGALGLVDNINTLMVRGWQFNPLDFGTPIVADTKLLAPELYLQDVWRARPSLTLTYGLSYGWQTSPNEKEGRMTILIDRENLTPQVAQDYLRARDEAARRGEIFNPELAFQTLNDPRRNLYDIDWNNVSPRASVAWTPDFSGGVLGKLFGERKTVIRGGYSLIYDRQNIAQSVILPTQGVGFAQTINVALPLCNATGDGGMNCNPTVANVGLNGFRLGVDGAIPIPAKTELTSPFSPAWGLRPGASTDTADPMKDVVLFPETVSFQVDQKIEAAQSHAFNFTWQRELPGRMVVEAGYVGRYASKLPQNTSLSQVPYQFLDTDSNQTFAQAFDALAAQLRGGVAAADVAPQGWFENQLRGTPLCNAPATNCTAGLAAAKGVMSSIVNGDVSNVFVTIDRNRIARGLTPFNNYLAKTLILRSSSGRSNYNAGFATLRKRFGQGLDFAVNYTFSRALDQFGLLQSSTAAAANSFDLDADYGPSPYDITHQFNSTGVWELPFGKGRRFLSGGGALDKIVGGWRSSWVFTLQSGEPLVVIQGPGAAWGGSFDGTGGSSAIPTIDPSSLNTGVNGSAAGVNFFDDPVLAYNSFRYVLLSSDGRSGRAHPLRGLPRWNLDMSFGKKTTIMENKILSFSADFFNIFNNVNYANPSLDLSKPETFGVITDQFTPLNRLAGSRWVQLGLRLEF